MLFRAGDGEQRAKSLEKRGGERACSWSRSPSAFDVAEVVILIGRETASLPLFAGPSAATTAPSPPRSSLLHHRPDRSSEADKREERRSARLHVTAPPHLPGLNPPRLTSPRLNRPPSTHPASCPGRGAPPQYPNLGCGGMPGARAGGANLRHVFLSLPALLPYPFRNQPLPPSRVEQSPAKTHPVPNYPTTALDANKAVRQLE